MKHFSQWQPAAMNENNNGFYVFFFFVPMRCARISDNTISA